MFLGLMLIEKVRNVTFQDIEKSKQLLCTARHNLALSKRVKVM